ncbi:MAG: 2-succinyl-5-enolpyruvyl-6-hydroxy-3-cyclohexene-1-carboxylic-acid synthase [Balneolaceae bacterium]|nr:2-succinyl-5-enolpyruvyl-6-hydroxy-3-cyclohexene-1-carboxylic-acid synthase [Balneolaceae bacterium]
MPDRDHQNLNFYWSTRFVRSLYRSGVQRVVISPGSRSTSLTLAFAAHPGFDKTIAIDERSAAFTALGMSKADKSPTCLVCTSGTAVANYYPAVIEAAQTGVPLIVLSADRPSYLRGIGASQTIDQLKIFGDYPVFFHEVGEPRDDDNSMNRLELAALQAVTKSMEAPGVSHLNFPFPKPFEPDNDFLKTAEIDNERQAKKKYQRTFSSQQKTKLSPEFWLQISEAEQPIIVAGPDIPKVLRKSVLALAKQLNAPILAEPGCNIPSSKYTITGFDGFLRNSAISESLYPDVILRFGRDPVSKTLQNYLKNYADVQQTRFHTTHLITDENLSADSHYFVKYGFEVSEMELNSNKDWIRNWRRYQKEYYASKERLMFPTSPLTDGYIFHTISEQIESKHFTMLSNSFPVRDMSLFGNYEGKEMYVNRGTAGIDGILSTTVGLSKVLNKAGVCFIGDIAFLHDSNALLLLQQIKTPLIIILLNNGGGTIFKMLPVSNYKKRYSEYFETPQQVSIAAMCRAHKIDHTLISRPEQLIPSFEAYIERPGVHIFECITDAEDSMELRRQLWNYSPDSE